MNELNAMMKQMMEMMMEEELRRPIEMPHLHPQMPRPRITEILVLCPGCDEMVYEDQIHDPSGECEYCCYCIDGEMASCFTYMGC